MAYENDPKKKIKVYAPDHTLWNKIGRANLDRIMTPEVIALAQNTIHQSSDQFFDESISHMEDLERFWCDLQKAPDRTAQVLPAIASVAFSLKSKAGVGGYDLISDLAKSLQLRCEELEGKQLTANNVGILDWHMSSLRQLLTARTKGLGGETGAAIVNELNRLN